ncbi:MAG: HAD family hydrolase [Acidobacteriota bacterium]|nr:HAD family hydrolase [Acidobacteriota bacterium]
MTRAVFFDVDFTLIYPGPSLQGEGHRVFCERHGVHVDADRFSGAVKEASSLLHSGDQLYDPQIFIDYTSRIIELMGGSGPGVDLVSREIYQEWAVCHHFSLYDDVAATLRRLHADGKRIGLISNTHRCLTSFQSHFELEGLISATVSSSGHGYMKPHPSIFQAALTLAGVTAEESVMVGDSYAHDIAGAQSLGMRGILIARGSERPEAPGCAVVGSLHEIFEHL